MICFPTPLFDRVYAFERWRLLLLLSFCPPEREFSPPSLPRFFKMLPPDGGSLGFFESCFRVAAFCVPPLSCTAVNNPSNVSRFVPMGSRPLQGSVFRPRPPVSSLLPPVFNRAPYKKALLILKQPLALGRRPLLPALPASLFGSNFRQVFRERALGAAAPVSHCNSDAAFLFFMYRWRCTETRTPPFV